MPRPTLTASFLMMAFLLLLLPACLPDSPSPTAAEQPLVIEGDLLELKQVIVGGIQDARRGFALAGGDINGDGFADLLVADSAPAGTLNHTDRVNLFLGSESGLSEVEDWSVSEESGNSDFGFVIGIGGDFNADGFDDVVVGAPGYTDGELGEGKVYVYYADSSVPGSTPDWSEESNEAFSKYGDALAAEGDVDGDGFSDLIVGSPLASVGQQEEGRCYLYFGKQNGLEQSAASWTGDIDEPLASFCSAVDSSADVNKDGFDDVLVGAPTHRDGPDSKGQVFLFLGSDSGPSETPSWSYELDISESRFGQNVAYVGDVNGDTHVDMLVEARDIGTGGAVYLFLGNGTSFEDQPEWVFEATAVRNGFGDSLAGRLDVTGDGFDDLLIGTPEFFRSVTGEEHGVRLFLGREDMSDAQTDWFVTSDISDTDFGISVANIGDTDGDGYPEFAVGSPLLEESEVGEGAVSIFSLRDFDSDGHLDINDNCITDANPGQEDTDGDQAGDLCDPCPMDPMNDSDGDGLCADEDPCPTDPNNEQARNGECLVDRNCSCSSESVSSQTNSWILITLTIFFLAHMRRRFSPS